MLIWTIQTIIVSIIFILLVHHLINFFKTNLTIPKTKDLVNTPTQKYEKMFNIISKNENTTSIEEIPDYNIQDFIPSTNDVDNKDNMKNELKNFLQSQIQNTADTNFAPLEKLTRDNSYSIYS